MTEAMMTRHEREDLQRLVRQREKALKASAKQRSAHLLADFDTQLSAEYRFDSDETWADATKLAGVEVETANKRVAERCQELGIPAEFAPRLSLNWMGRGRSNAVKERREELRRVAQSRIAAIEASACTAIELASVEAQTKLALAGLTSEGAAAFIAALPSVEDLMKEPSFADLSGTPQRLIG